MDNATVITIDGPAASGKSTVARRVAEELGFEYLDTGATFRLLTLMAVEKGVQLSDEDALVELAGHISIGIDPDLKEHVVKYDGRSVGDRIRTPEITRQVVNIAGLKEVRNALLKIWRNFAAGRKVVVEGRDQGTSAFPDARYKFFLNASPEERARRRWIELQEKGIKGDLKTQEDLEREIAERDESDKSREVAPLIWEPEGATVIDTTRLSVDQVIEKIVTSVRGAKK